jgi:hypothetical protein
LCTATVFWSFFLFPLVTTCFGPLDHLQDKHTVTISHLTYNRSIVFKFISLLFFACRMILSYSAFILNFNLWYTM